jgi:hypothetical protein
MTSEPTSEQAMAVRVLLLMVGAAALLAGLYGRFKGIGTWPLGVDEFYISRSVDNVLRTGLPQFPCGGYYTRGLLFQYVVAGLRLLGCSPEFAGRFVAALASLLVLPAVYLLGKRVQGTTLAWLVAVIFCVSVWEIEMARFARMYAPFQAVFAWYLVAYLKYTVDRRAGALWQMVALTVLGVLTWEGGALLGAANLFAVVVCHENGRLKPGNWPRLLGLALLLAACYEGTLDFRQFADAPLAAGALPEVPVTQLQRIAEWFSPLPQHAAWLVAFCVPLLITVPAVRQIKDFRERWLRGVGLCLVLAAAAAHAFLAAMGVLLMLLLLRLVDRHDLTWRRARFFWLALGAFLLYWGAAVGFRTPHASAILQALFGFPDVYDQVMRPWVRTLPILSAGIGVAIAYLCWVSVTSAQRAADSIAALLSLLVLLVMAVGATATDRVETRYTFFLYPLLMVLACGAIFVLARRHRSLCELPPLAIAAVPLIWFGFTRDFQPRHVLHVDSGKINFRVGMSSVLSDHYYPRNEIKSVADWLTSQVKPGDVVIAGIPSLDQYYGHIDYFFLDEGDSRYESYVCPDNKTERWTNHQVLYSMDALKPIVESGRRVYVNLYASSERHLKEYAVAAGWSVALVWTAEYGSAHMMLVTAR